MSGQVFRCPTYSIRKRVIFLPPVAPWKRASVEKRQMLWLSQSTEVLRELSIINTCVRCAVRAFANGERKKRERENRMYSLPLYTRLLQFVCDNADTRNGHEEAPLSLHKLTGKKYPASREITERTELETERFRERFFTSTWTFCNELSKRKRRRESFF